MGDEQSKFRISNDSKDTVTAVVNPTRSNIGLISSIAVNLPYVQVISEIDNREVPPGMVKLSHEDTLEFQVRRPYISILKSNRSKEEATWMWINHYPPPNRNIIVTHKGTAVLTKKGTIWTPETGEEPKPR